MSFSTKLISLLKTDLRFVDDDGELLIAAVLDRAWKVDHALVKLLLSVKDIKTKFFDEVEGHWIFNINIFIEYISNKSFLDNSYTRFKNRIGLTIGDKFLRERDEIVLAWPYKDTVLEGGQTKEDEKRKEIFFNEVLAQDEITRLLDLKVLTHFKRHTVNGEEKVTDFLRDETGVIHENFIIKGNNLLALHTLKTQFRGKVKMIYIDPPYNTDNDSFQYNDSFSLSTWLTFMRNRLSIAKELLSDDGAIFIQISDVRVGYLRLLMDEIFRIENFINQITVRTKSPSGFKTVNLGVFETAEYIIVYGKSKKKWRYETQYTQSDWDENYKYEVVNRDANPREWIIKKIEDLILEKHKFRDKKTAVKKLGSVAFKGLKASYAIENCKRVFRLTEINDDASKETVDLREMSRSSPERIFQLKRNGMPDRYVLDGQEIYFYANKVKLLDGSLVPTMLLTNIWNDIAYEGIANEGGVKLKKGKKPEKLVKRIIEMSTEKDDLVMDFHLGSGTTCAVAHKMGRRYIGIEQLDYGDNDSVKRLANVINGDLSGVSKLLKWQGGGNFIYCELMKYNETYMECIQNAKSSEALLKIWHDMAEGSCMKWYVNSAMPEEAVNNFISLGKEPNGLEKQKHLLAEVLDKNQLYVNLSEIDDVQFKISKEDKVLNKAFYRETNNV